MSEKENRQKKYGNNDPISGVSRRRQGRPMKKYPPTPDEIREWMDRKGLSNKDVAKALHLSDGRVVRFWTSKKDPRPIPYPSWYTLRHKFGK
jgi:hypothetical protein